MNTQKSVFNKISKIEREVESKEVELSEVQKVELGSVQDFNRAADSFKQGAKKYNDANSELLRYLRDFTELQQKIKASYRTAASFSDQIEDAIKNIEDLADKVSQQAKELGIKPADLIDVSVVNDVAQVEGDLQNFQSNEDLAKRILGV